MTICVAAIAAKKYAVLAADRTLTMQLAPVELNHEHTSKLYDIEPGLVIGTSGSPVYIPELLRLLKGTKGRGTEYVARVSNAFFMLRREEIEKGILRRFGWDYPTYEKHYSEGNMLEAQARKIMEELDEFHVCLHIVAGTVLASGEASISAIEDPTGSARMDAVGFVSVGSGSDHADQVLMRANQSAETPLPDTIYHVFEAKKMAEQAYGVGRRTDIRIVAAKNRIIHLTDDDVTKLGHLYETKAKQQTGAFNRALEKVRPALKGTLGRLVN